MIKTYLIKTYFFKVEHYNNAKELYTGIFVVFARDLVDAMEKLQRKKSRNHTLDDATIDICNIDEIVNLFGEDAFLLISDVIN